MTIENPTTLFRGARLILGDGESVLDQADLVVAGTTIADIRPRPDRSVPPPSGTTVVECAGRTIMPAIVSPHGHIGYMRGTTCDAEFFTRDNIVDHLRRLAYAGVSTFQSLGTDRGGLELSVRDEQRERPESDPDLATLFSAGSGLVAPTPGSTNGGPFFAVDAVRETSDPHGATNFVRKLAGRKVDIVKFWVDDRGCTKGKLGPETQRAIVAEAHRHGIPTAAHIYTVDDAKSAIRAGADVLAHMPRNARPDQELLDLLLAHDVAVFTSMSIQAPLTSEWLADPLVRDITPPAAVDQLQAQIEARAAEPLFDTAETYRGLVETFRDLYAAGIRLVFSADTGLLAQLPGIAEHRELEALVSAGLSPLEAIRLATSESARLLGLGDRGLLAPGRRADLLILDGDPLADIRQTRRVDTVYLAGRRLDRDQMRTRWQTTSRSDPTGETK